MQARHKVRAGSNGDTELGQMLAHGRGVQQVGQRPGVDLTGLPTTRAAVQPRGVGVVGALATVPGQQHQRRKVAHQAHGGQHLVGNGRALLRRAQGLRHLRAHAGGLAGGKAGVFPARGRGGRGQTVFDQLGPVQQAQRLDKAEARRGRGPKLLPPRAPLQRAAPPCRQHLGQVGVARAFGDAQRGRQQARQLRPRQAAAHRCVRNGQTKKAGKTAGLHGRVHALPGAAKHLRAHVDAKQGLHSRCGFCRRGV